MKKRKRNSAVEKTKILCDYIENNMSISSVCEKYQITQKIKVFSINLNYYFKFQNKLFFAIKIRFIILHCIILTFVNCLLLKCN